jgi:hypothetical protein
MPQIIADRRDVDFVLHEQLNIKNLKNPGQSSSRPRVCNGAQGKY